MSPSRLAWLPPPAYTLQRFNRCPHFTHHRARVCAHVCVTTTIHACATTTIHVCATSIPPLPLPRPLARMLSAVPPSASQTPLEASAPLCWQPGVRPREGGRGREREGERGCWQPMAMGGRVREREGESSPCGRQSRKGVGLRHGREGMGGAGLGQGQDLK